MALVELDEAAHIVPDFPKVYFWPVEKNNKNDKRYIHGSLINYQTPLYSIFPSKLFLTLFLLRF